MKGVRMDKFEITKQLISQISGIIIQMLKSGCTKKPAIWRCFERPNKFSLYYNVKTKASIKYKYFLVSRVS